MDTKQDRCVNHDCRFMESTCEVASMSLPGHTHIAERVDCLYKIYRDQVEFLFINITVYDGYMPVYDYFGPAAGRMIADHPVTPAEKARTAKMFYMGHPQVSIPIVLDDMGQSTRNSFMDPGGAGSFCLVDIEGRVASGQSRYVY